MQPHITLPLKQIPPDRNTIKSVPPSSSVRAPSLEEMQQLLRHAQSGREQTVDRIRQLVECESPSYNARAVNRCAELLIAQARDVVAAAARIPAAGFGDHLELTFQLPGQVDRPPLLLLGHLDTVWPVGTLSSMPFRRSPERLFGPGVLDMKTGLVMAMDAVRLLRDLDISVNRQVTLLVVSDEEVGSPSSRALTESLAQRNAAVLVLEPGTGLEGKLKTSRKGVGRYRLQVTGQPAHAGVDFEKGASAVLELARQLLLIADFTDLQNGVTVNPGLIQGGTASNVIAETAYAEIDVRVPRAQDESRLQQQLAALTPIHPRCTLQLSGGPNRPPMERTPAIAALFHQAQALASEMNVSLEESSTGGGSDGNFTAALGIPTLDGLGPIGEGAHARYENVLIDRIPDRIALLASLIARI